MDSFTQAILGAAVGKALLGKKSQYQGALAGAIIGTIPDLDVILLPFFNELQKISIHRGYSHSILFCLLGSFLIAFALSRWKWAQEFRFRRLWMTSFLALFTHVLLDSFTTFGTQLFLPFTDWRVSFDSITIIDPVYTLPIALGLGISIYRSHNDHPRRAFPNQLGLIISSLYLMFTLANKQNVQKVFYKNLEQANISYFRMLTVPVSAANLVWYGVVKDENNLYLGKYSLLEDNPVSFESFAINEELLEGIDPLLVDRLKWFAQDFYTLAEDNGKIRMYNMQCDMQGIRTFGDYKAPTAFYYEIQPLNDGDYRLETGMHPEE